jgi:hypothetical protein
MSTVLQPTTSGKAVLKTTVFGHCEAAADGPLFAPAQPLADSQEEEEERAWGMISMISMISFFDRYLGRVMRIPTKLLQKVLLPCQLVYVSLCVHAQRSHRPPPCVPHYMRLQFLPLQLQRFLRGCVLATAHALVAPPASVCRLVHARTKSRWIDRIFVRVMSGFVVRAEVWQQEACCECACRTVLTSLYLASACIVWPSSH